MSSDPDMDDEDPRRLAALVARNGRRQDVGSAAVGEDPDDEDPRRLAARIRARHTARPDLPPRS